jgi:hypothetical protein
MSALTILIIRHAEKQGESWSGSGLMPNGVPDKNSLVIAVGNGLAAGPRYSGRALGG